MKELRHDLTTRRYWRHFVLNTLAGVGALSVVVNLVAVFYPQSVIDNRKILIVASILLSVGYGGYRSWPRSISETYSTPNVTIRLEKGDLLDQECHLVIGFCDTFDTSVPEIIARTSLQGQFLERTYNNDAARLDGDIERALVGIKPEGTITKMGKTVQYGVGAVVTLGALEHKHFLLAYTRMDGTNQARATADGVWKALGELWRVVGREANGGTVAIPVIGGGQARLAQILPAQDSIRFIALSFMLASRHEKVCDELRIVVRPTEYERLDRLEIQAFLTSLRPS